MKKITLTDIYKSSEVPPCAYNMYREVLNEFHITLMEHLVRTGNPIKLPARLGYMQVKKTQGRKKAIDFKKTKEYGTLVYHNNLHSEGYYALYIWNKDKPQAVFSNKQMFKFVPTRGNKRSLARQIKENNTIDNYIEF